MRKYYKVVASILLFSLFFSGCSVGNSKKSDEIVVWSSLTDLETIQVRKIAEQWGKETGHKVKVHSDKGDNRAYIEAAKSNIEPDIEFGVSHDRMEKLHSEKLLAEIPENVVDKSKYISSAIQTASFNNKLYGIPISIETYGLYYNKDKAKNPPETLESLIEQGKKLGFEYDVNNFYLSYPFLKANGAYIFNKNGEKYDVNDVGLNNEGAIKGYTTIQDLVQKHKIMPANIEGITARKDFEAGKIAFYIGGTTDIEEINKSNINYAVAPLPKCNGVQMGTFVTTKVAYVSSKSKHEKEAWELMKYLLNKSPEALFKVTGRIPALNETNNISQVKDSDKLKMFLKQAQYGETVPNVTEIQALQDANKILKSLTEGKISPKECGAKIENNIKEFIKKEKQ